MSFKGWTSAVSGRLWRTSDRRAPRPLGRFEVEVAVLVAVGEALFGRDLGDAHHVERLRAVVRRMPSVQRVALVAASAALDLGHLATAGERFASSPRAARQAALRRWEESDSAATRGLFQLLKMTAILGLPAAAHSPSERESDASAIPEAAQ